MVEGIKESTQFKINELTLVTKGGNLDISSVYSEINIYDSLFTPVMSGNIVITDSAGLAGKLLFDGSEVLLMDIAKTTDSDIASFKKSFRIYKQSDGKNTGQSASVFVLHFISDEFIFSSQQVVNQSFQCNYTKAVEVILLNYLKVPKTQLTGIYEQSYGVRQIVIPSLKPLEAIDWCSKRAVDLKQSPNFVFFQNISGYNFVTLSKLLSQREVLDIKFGAKNLKDSNPIQEMSSARAMQIVQQSNEAERIKTGVNAAKFIGFDPISKIIANKNIGFGDVFNSMKHGNDTPNFSEITNRLGLSNSQMFDSKRVFGKFDAGKKFSNYVKEFEAASLSLDDNAEAYIVQRAMLFGNLMSKRVRVLMPGNFQLSSGFNVNFEAPNFSKKEKGEDSIDKSLSGRYTIVGSRHIIGRKTHETSIEIATTSSGNDFIPVSNSQQNNQVLSYA